MKLSKEEVTHIATLCRVGMTDADLEKFSDQLSNILEQFEVLKSVNTDGVEPTAHSIPLNNVWREDVAHPSLREDEVLANAPDKEEGFIKVKQGLED